VNRGPAPAADEPAEKSFGDRVLAGLAGAGIGAVIGFLALNGLGRGRYRAWAAGPMNAQASLAWAGIGAAIGAIAGFTRGKTPLDQEPQERVVHTIGSPQAPIGPPQPQVAGVSHPAFALLQG
jgi:hypothetical protein